MWGGTKTVGYIVTKLVHIELEDKFNSLGAELILDIFPEPIGIVEPAEVKGHCTCGSKARLCSDGCSNSSSGI